jgi:hypothetical protein
MLAIPRQETLDPVLKQAFGRVRSGRRNSTRRFKVDFRASALPVCPRLYHIYRRLPIEKRPFQQDSFVSDAAAMCGTAMHLALQKWFGIEAQLFGNWECLPCGWVSPKPVAGLQTCPKCQQPAIYKELEVLKVRRVPFTGHMDAVLQTPSTWILDFKVVSPKKIYEVRQNGAYRRHFYQINAYANAINLGEQPQTGLDHVDGVVLVYVDRGDPWINWQPVQYPVSQKIYRETLTLIAAGKHSLKELKPPRGICVAEDDPEAKWCPARQMCWSPLLETMLLDTVQPRDLSDRDRTYDSLLQKESKNAERQTEWDL